MINLTPEVVAIGMLGIVLVGLLIGIPIAYVLGAAALLFGFPFFGPQIGKLIYARIWGLLINYTLLAVPLFIFMGLILERSGITERLYDVLYLWLGGIRGGLGIVTIIVGTVLAACVGTVSASVSMLTLVALPSMLKRGYDKKLTTGAICAAGCLGILIPPSVMLVIYGPMAQISVGRLFFGAFMPGFLLSALYMLYILAAAWIDPTIGPAVPPGEVKVPFLKKTGMLMTALVPPVLLVAAVLGTIFFGIAPPTEAASVGAFSALLLVVAYRRFTWKVLTGCTLLTMQISAFIFLVAVMSFAFTGVFIGAGGGDVVSNLILATPGGKWGAFLIVMFIVFILGFFIDWIGIVFIMIPILAPIVPKLGFDPVWFAIMVCVNLQTSFMTPPFAMAIFIVKGAADPALGVTLADIIRGVIPFVILILVGLALCVAFPGIILWLPGKMIK
jgi:tripartite ATP-independent transporter DctM subunit